MAPGGCRPVKESAYAHWSQEKPEPHAQPRGPNKPPTLPPSPTPAPPLGCPEGPGGLPLRVSLGCLLVLLVSWGSLGDLCWEEAEQPCWGSCKSRIITLLGANFHHRFAELLVCAGRCWVVGQTQSPSEQMGAQACGPSFLFPCFYPLRRLKLGLP